MDKVCIKIITCIEPSDVSLCIDILLLKGKKKGQFFFIVIFLNVSGMKVFVEVSSKALV